jgi:hypothetical protein
MRGARLRTVAGAVVGVALAVALAWLSLLLFSGDDPTLVPPPSTTPVTTAASARTTGQARQAVVLAYETGVVRPRPG